METLTTKENTATIRRLFEEVLVGDVAAADRF